MYVRISSFSERKKKKRCFLDQSKLCFILIMFIESFGKREKNHEIWWERPKNDNFFFFFFLSVNEIKTHMYKKYVYRHTHKN